MKICMTDLVKEKINEPPVEEVEKMTDVANRIFAKCGLDQTDLTKSVAPVFGRILFDLKGADMNFWSNGRPGIVTEYAETNKGVMLAGSVGVGKTTIMRCMAARLSAEYFTVPRLASIFSESKGADNFWKQVSRARKWDIFLDDLGAEDIVKNYSNKFPIEEFLYDRYNSWQSTGVRIHISTNLSGEEIENRYGLRVRDRLREMTVGVPCVGSSLRR